MLPTSLPELPGEMRDPRNNQKLKNLLYIFDKVYYTGGRATPTVCFFVHNVDYKGRLVTAGLFREEGRAREEET